MKMNMDIVLKNLNLKYSKYPKSYLQLKIIMQLQAKRSLNHKVYRIQKLEKGIQIQSFITKIYGKHQETT